jgi:Carboxypeptidase regulatory-like domain
MHTREVTHMSNSAHASFARLSAQIRNFHFAGILKAVISGKWLVARKSPRTRCLNKGTQYRNARPRQPLATSHSPLATRLHPFPLAVCALFAFLSLPPHLPAQTGLATLSGTVTDPTGALLPKATVTVTNEDTGVTVKGETTRAGVYAIEALKPGRYRVFVEHQGFKQIEVIDLVLHTQDVISRNFILPIGAASEVIQVNGNRESIDQSPGVSLTVSSEFVENMPLNGRSFQDLISLAPGTASSSVPNTGAGLYSINGQRDDANYFTVDGVSSNTNSGFNTNSNVGPSGVLPAQTALGTTQSLVSVDSLQEFTIQTSSYSAEYGRQPGGQIQLTTKSGTENLHGSVFDYFRNEAMDANNWFFNDQGIPRQAERQNDFGGTFGGPFGLPGTSRKVKDFFFFFSYEGLRLQTPQFTGIANVPTAQFRSFANSNIAALLNSMPLPNVAGNLENGDQCASTLGLTFSCTGQFAAGYSTPSEIDATSVRVDKTFGNRLQLFARYADTPTYTLTRVDLNSVNSAYGNSRVETVGATIKVSDRSVAELRLNHTSDESGAFSYLDSFHGGTPYDPSILVPGQYVSQQNFAAIPFVQFGGIDDILLPGIVGSGTQGSKQDQWNVVGNISKQHASHSIKVGFDYRQLRPTENVDGGDYAALPNFFSLAGIQQGFVDSYLVETGIIARPTFRNLSLYAVDAWKPVSRLTITYGLRWDLNPAPGAANGLYPLALTSSNIQTSGIAPSGTPQYHTNYLDFAPRLGFSYVIGDAEHKPLVLRGGSGLFFDTGQSLGAVGYGGFPFQNVVSVSNVQLPSTVPAPVVPVPLTVPLGYINGICDPNLKVPYTEQWSLSLDKGLSNTNTVTVSYVGNNGKKLLKSDYYGSTSNPLFTGFQLSDNNGYSSYNSLQIQDRGRMSSYAEVIGSYTWAHAIDNVSSDFEGSQAPARGNSSNDIRQVFNFALNTHLPEPQGNKLVKSILEGWSFGSRGTAETGYPLDVISGYYSLDGTEFNLRPDLNQGVPPYIHNKQGVLGQWALNPAAFTVVPTDPTTGLPLSAPTLGRDFLHGPNFWTLNQSMERSFHLGERSKLDFRVDAFNIFNHQNPGSIDVNIGDGPNLFGNPDAVQTIGVPNQLYASGSPRSLQLSLKISF